MTGPPPPPGARLQTWEGLRRAGASWEGLRQTGQTWEELRFVYDVAPPVVVDGPAGGVEAGATPGPRGPGAGGVRVGAAGRGGVRVGAGSGGGVGAGGVRVGAAGRGAVGVGAA